MRSGTDTRVPHGRRMSDASQSQQLFTILNHTLASSCQELDRLVDAAGPKPILASLLVLLLALLLCVRALALSTSKLL